MKVLAPSLVASLLLSACGQAGPLVLPGQKPKPVAPIFGSTSNAPAPMPATSSSDTPAGTDAQQSDVDNKTKPAAKP